MKKQNKSPSPTPKFQILSTCKVDKFSIDQLGVADVLYVEINNNIKFPHYSDK